MDIFFWWILFIFGTLFWSFGSVIIHRLYSWEWWICSGRSHCGSCQHPLSAIDLIPIFSWLAYKAKCKYCKSKIPIVYPLLELSTGLLFACIWFFFIDPVLLFSGNTTEIIKLWFWLTIGFLSILYTFYDILFLEIHEGMMLTWVILWFIWVTAQSFGISIIPYLNTDITLSHLQLLPLIGTSIMVLIGLYIILLKELKSTYDLIILFISGLLLYFSIDYFNISINEVPLISGIIAAYCIYLFFFLQILLSNGKAMWGWDLRIAIMVWLLLGGALAIPGMMATYIVGSLIWIWLLISDKMKKKSKKWPTTVPFGPFLALWFFITIFTQHYIFQFINTYFIY